LDRSLIDRIETVDDDEALTMAKALSAQEGILAGVSSGAALVASLRVAKDLGAGKKVVTLFPDKGERYFSIEKYFKMS
jgi:cysteine synthase A